MLQLILPEFFPTTEQLGLVQLVRDGIVEMSDGAKSYGDVSGWKLGRLSG